MVNGREEAFAQAPAQVRRTPARRGEGQFADFISFGGFRRLPGGEQVVLAGRDAFLHGLHEILLYASDRRLRGRRPVRVLIRAEYFAAHGARRLSCMLGLPSASDAVTAAASTCSTRPCAAGWRTRAGCRRR